MYNFQKIWLLLVAVASMSSCNTLLEEKKVPKTCVLIFCDLTSSITPEGVNDLSNNVGKLLRGLPAGSWVQIYPIDDNLQEHIAQIELPMNESTVSIDKDVAKQKQKNLIDRVQKAIQNRYKKVNESKDKEHSSCIITSLERAYDFFKNKKNSAKFKEYNFEIVYFSDMVEQCSSSRAGAMYMCSDFGSYVPNKANIEKQIEDKLKLDYNLKGLVGNNLSMVITNNLYDKSPSNCLRPEEIKDLWRKILQQYGYTMQDTDKLHFGTHVPEKFILAE